MFWNSTAGRLPPNIKKYLFCFYIFLSYPIDMFSAVKRIKKQNKKISPILPVLTVYTNRAYFGCLVSCAVTHKHFSVKRSSRNKISIVQIGGNILNLLSFLSDWLEFSSLGWINHSWSLSVKWPWYYVYRWHFLLPHLILLLKVSTYISFHIGTSMSLYMLVGCRNTVPEG